MKPVPGLLVSLFQSFLWAPPHLPNSHHWGIPGLGSRTLLFMFSRFSLGELIKSHAFKDHLEDDDPSLGLSPESPPLLEM